MNIETITEVIGALPKLPPESIYSVVVIGVMVFSYLVIKVVVNALTNRNEGGK
ncbi:hypothetical protein [Vibrio parahaemolyticus]|uniref:hypothetical protein n=1 Tax=Vibrio parahaemolyticus TaxID=670 RepID=UPI003891C32A